MRMDPCPDCGEHVNTPGDHAESCPRWQGVPRDVSRETCVNCGRVLVPGQTRPWCHRLEDFDEDKAIDCLRPQPTGYGVVTPSLYTRDLANAQPGQIAVWSAEEEAARYRAAEDDILAVAMERKYGAPRPLYSFHVPAPLEWKARKGTGKLYQVPKWMNSNHRLNPHARNDLTQEWRQITAVRAREARLPRGLVSRVFIEAWFHTADNRAYDAQNLYPTAKAMVDGLVLGKGKMQGYGMLKDDSNKHVVGPLCLPGSVEDKPGVTLRIHALPPGGLYPTNYIPYAKRGKDLI